MCVIRAAITPFMVFNVCANNAGSLAGTETYIGNIRVYTRIYHVQEVATHDTS